MFPTRRLHRQYLSSTLEAAQAAEVRGGVDCRFGFDCLDRAVSAMLCMLVIIQREHRSRVSNEKEEQ